MISKNFNLNSTKKKYFYSPIISSLKTSTNLTKIKEKLSISKQKLNYYLRQLVNNGFIVKKGTGWYEVVKGVKISTKYGFLPVKDSIRGHAYIWKLKIEKIPEDWDKRIEVLKNKGVNYKIVGAKENTPRIKVQGRKVWLCNDHLRVFDKKEESYYGKTAKESRVLALNEIKLIVDTLNRKLGTNIKPCDIYFQKEHYALIKNDLAIEENRNGNIIRIRDEIGEWLLIDDSLEKGGELETIGKNAYKINIPMQKWWNDNKKHNFEVTPTFLVENINRVTQNQLMFNQNLESHISSVKQLGNSAQANATSVELLAEVICNLKEEVLNLNEEIKKLNETGN